MNRASSHTKGYTIVETMIFLAISGALLISAMFLISGQQRKTQFSSTVRDFDSKLQGVISNVATGYYNSTGKTTCILAGGGASINSVTTGGPTNQGQNSDCTFIGLVMVPYASTGGGAFDRVSIYSTAGLRLKPGASATEVTSMADAKPYLIDQTKETYTFNGGVTISIKFVGAGTIGSLGVFTSFNQYASTLSSGSTTSDLYAIFPSDPTGPIQGALAANPPGPGDYSLNPPNVTHPSNIEICITDQVEFGAIVLNNGNTRTTIGSGNTCP